MQTKYRRILGAIALVLALFLILQYFLMPKALSQSWAEAMYKSKKYPSADKVLSKNASGQDDIAKANLAKSKYQQGKYQDAETSAKAALTATPDSPDRNYDLGDIAYRLGDYKTALEHFRKAMLKDPKDRDAKANYELALKKMQQQPQSKPQNQQNKQDKQQEQNQQKQQDIRNILGGLDSKESSDRKSNQAQGGAGGDKWW